jgi:hypothetical protein
LSLGKEFLIGQNFGIPISLQVILLFKGSFLCKLFRSFGRVGRRGLCRIHASRVNGRWSEGGRCKSGSGNGPCDTNSGPPEGVKRHISIAETTREGSSKSGDVERFKRGRKFQGRESWMDHVGDFRVSGVLEKCRKIAATHFCSLEPPSKFLLCSSVT